MNPISENLVKGTLGELLVQARLLCYGVQAAPPLKDSGNDLIAVRHDQFRAIQVKTTQGPSYDLPEPDRLYHILAAVQLVGEGDYVDFEKSKIYLISYSELDGLSRQFSKIQKWEINQALVDFLFQKEE
ncbi:MAG TPA: hypothetical protein VGM64_05080 [Lacunisphaera sp.]|jgi:hypothetical protein